MEVYEIKGESIISHKTEENNFLKSGQIWAEKGDRLYRILSLKENTITYEYLNAYYYVKVISSSITDFLKECEGCVLLLDGLGLYEKELMELGYYLEGPLTEAKVQCSGNLLTLNYKIEGEN